MNPHPWLAVVIAIPPTIVSTLVLIAWALREKFDARVLRALRENADDSDRIVFDALRRNHGAWVEEAQRVEGFKPLFVAGRLIELQQQQIESLHALVRDTMGNLSEKVGAIDGTLQKFQQEVHHLSNAVEKLSPLLQTVAALDERTRGRRS